MPYSSFHIQLARTRLVHQLVEKQDKAAQELLKTQREHKVLLEALRVRNEQNRELRQNYDALHKVKVAVVKRHSEIAADLAHAKAENMTHDGQLGLLKAEVRWGREQLKRAIDKNKKLTAVLVDTRDKVEAAHKSLQVVEG